MLTIVYCYNVKQKKQELVEHIIPWLVDLPSGYVRIVPYRATTTKRSRVAIYDSFYTWWHSSTAAWHSKYFFLTYCTRDILALHNAHSHMWTHCLLLGQTKRNDYKTTTFVPLINVQRRLCREYWSVCQLSTTRKQNKGRSKTRRWLAGKCDLGGNGSTILGTSHSSARQKRFNILSGESSG